MLICIENLKGVLLKMQYQTPKLKENDLTIVETINQQFLNSFPVDETANPKKAIETCDLHLSGLQPIKFVDPKKNWVSDIYWKEPKDLQMYWSKQEHIFLLLIGVSSLIFCLMIYYFSGVKIV